MEVDRELEERLALERKAKRMREQSDGSGWVALDEKKDQGTPRRPSYPFRSAFSHFSFVPSYFLLLIVVFW